MKFAMLGLYIEYYLKLSIAWGVIILVFHLLTLKAKPNVRIATLIVAFASVPVYVGLGLDKKYDQYVHEKNRRQQRIIADRSSQFYKDVCAKKPDIDVKKVVRQTAPIDIRVIETKTYFGLDLIRLQPLGKKACWTVADFGSCSRSNIGNVEWSAQSKSFGCNPPKCKNYFYRNDRTGRPIAEIDGFSTKYGLYVSAPEKVDPLIQKYKVAIVEIDTSEVLAETYIFKKDWLMEKSVTEMNEPYQCPESDVHIADMLSQVFPITSNLSIPR